MRARAAPLPALPLTFDWRSLCVSLFLCVFGCAPFPPYTRRARAPGAPRAVGVMGLIRLAKMLPIVRCVRLYLLFWSFPLPNATAGLTRTQRRPCVAPTASASSAALARCARRSVCVRVVCGAGSPCGVYAFAVARVGQVGEILGVVDDKDPSRQFKGCARLRMRTCVCAAAGCVGRVRSRASRAWVSYHGGGSATNAKKVVRDVFKKGDTCARRAALLSQL